MTIFRGWHPGDKGATNQTRHGEVSIYRRASRISLSEFNAEERPRLSENGPV
jgi:hypothetical protein